MLANKGNHKRLIKVEITIVARVRADVKIDSSVTARKRGSDHRLERLETNRTCAAGLLRLGSAISEIPEFLLGRL